MSTSPTPAAADHDAFGHALLDWTNGGTDLEVYERDDGLVEAGPGPDAYLAAHTDWPVAERRAIKRARGRVVDLGCGAGRVALHLEDRGLDVLAVDSSPLAVRAARARGVRRAVALDAARLPPRLRAVDTVVLYGNNLGMAGSPERVRRALSSWARAMPAGGRVLAASTDPATDGVPALDGTGRRRNRALRNDSGAMRLRIRYRQWRTPWFSWLFMSPAVLGRLVRDTGWSVSEVVTGRPDEPFVAVLDKA